MAFEEQITETIEAGAPSIKYEGDIQQQQQIAQQLWENLPPEARAQFGSFEQFFSSGAWKKVLQMLQQQQQQGQQPQQMAQGPQQMAPQPQEGIGSMMPAQMADGGDVRLASASDPMDDRNQISLQLFGKPVHELNPDEEMQLDDWLEDKAQKWGGAYGGIAGADGRRQYGIGSWFQKKIMDPIKKNIVPLGLGAASLYGLSKYGGDKGIMGGLGRIGTGIKNIFTDTSVSGTDRRNTTVPSGLSKFLGSANFLIPAASLVSGAFAKKDDPGYTGQGTGLNLQDIAKVANITDEKQGAAVGLNFLPEASARKYSPEEMAATYAGAAHGGRIGYATRGIVDENIVTDFDEASPAQEDIRVTIKQIAEQSASPASFPATDSDFQALAMLSDKPDDFPSTDYDFEVILRIAKEINVKAPEQSKEEIYGNYMAEGGLMSLGGNEMDLRGGGFVPIGAKEKADDVPARLSKNEFVFTADAVRAAGGGNVDAGADKMYNTMKQLEGRVG
jgi:hypothetical protein